MHLNISADEHLQAGAENPWTTWKALNRLRTQVGRSRVNMLKWGFSNEQETCACDIRQTMQHLLVCPMMDTACSPQYLTTANDIAIDCARHWEGTTCRTYDSQWHGNDFSTGWSRPNFSSWGSGGRCKAPAGSGAEPRRQADFDNNLLKINWKSGLWVDGRIGSADRICDKSC